MYSWHYEENVTVDYMFRSSVTAVSIVHLRSCFNNVFAMSVAVDMHLTTCTLVDIIRIVVACKTWT